MDHLEMKTISKVKNLLHYSILEEISLIWLVLMTNLDDLWNHFKQSNICVVESQKEKKRIEKVFKDTVVKFFQIWLRNINSFHNQIAKNHW